MTETEDACAEDACNGRARETYDGATGPVETAGGDTGGDWGRTGTSVTVVVLVDRDSTHGVANAVAGLGATTVMMDRIVEVEVVVTV